MSAVYADDLISGASYPSGEYTVSAPEIVEFARRWDPLPMHTDADAAAAGYFGGLIASGVHTLGIWQRLAVLNILPGWQIIAGRELRVVLPAPVRAGATLSGELDILGIAPLDGRRSVVSERCRLRDDTGVLVFEMHVEVVMSRRPSSV